MQSLKNLSFLFTKNFLARSEKIKEGLLVSVVLLPLLWINVRNSQHWGDDFAVYVGQAINISERNPFDYTTYQYIDSFCSLTPSAPVGFSLLLVPVYKIFGFNMYAFSLYLSLFYVAWAILSYVLARRFFNPMICITFLIAAFYPNFMLWLKLLITSDVPFSFFLLASVLFITSSREKGLVSWLFAAALVFLCVLIRPVGAIIFPAICFHFFQGKRNKSQSETLTFTALILLLTVPVFLYVIFNYLLFVPSVRYERFSLQALNLNALPHVILTNIQSHGLDYLNLFRSSNEEYTDVSATFSYVMLSLTVCGFVIKCCRQIDLFDWVLISYMGFIFCYPVRADYRYISPVHPFLIFYLFYALTNITSYIGIVFSAFIPQLVITAAFLLIYADHLKYLIKTTHETVPGPYEEICQDTFHFLKEKFPDNEIIVFNKPRALALYTGKKTTCFDTKTNASSNLKMLKARSIRYYLYSWQLAETDYNAILEANKNHMIDIYKNWQFTLYKDTTVLEN